MLAAVLSAGMVSCASDDTNNPKEETAETTTLAVETEIDQEQLLYVDLPQLDFGGIAINILGYTHSYDKIFRTVSQDKDTVLL